LCYGAHFRGVVCTRTNDEGEREVEVESKK